jgi:CRISPR-associated protein (TIGR03986 family)
LNRGEAVPVFWLRDEDGEEDTPIAAMGLAMMFRLPYDYRPRERARAHQDGDASAPDLAETIFGFFGGDQALKGRVAFSDALPAVSDRPVAERDPVRAQLLAPKPNFYPAYVRQVQRDRQEKDKVPLVADTVTNRKSGVANYTTFMDAESVPRGWKRYPVATAVREPNPPPEDRNRNVNTAVQTEFTPMVSGTRLQATIRFHNLRPTELGALVWALTFGEDGAGDSRWHALGGARNLGYGATKIRITDATLEPNDPDAPRRTGDEAVRHLWDWAVPAFQTYMAEHVSDWSEDNAQIRELIATATPVKGDDVEKLHDLGWPQKFQTVKRNRRYLRLHSDEDDPGSGPPQGASSPGGQHGPSLAGSVENNPASAQSGGRRRTTVGGEDATIVSQDEQGATVIFDGTSDPEPVELDDLDT